MSKFYKLNGSKYDICHDFFENIDSEIKAYLLGFYVADGNVFKKRNTLTIAQNINDKEIIDLYREHIGPNCRIYIPQKSESYINGKKYHRSAIYLTISSAKLIQPLIDMGYGDRKTYKELNMPDLSDELLIHFIRGYFDGDGCVSIWDRREKWRKVRPRCTINFASKTSTLVLEIQEFLNKFGINFNYRYAKSTDMFIISTCSKNMIHKFYDLIYRNSHYFLTRKKEKLENYVNTEILQKTTEDCNA